MDRFAGTCLFAHGERPKCARGVTAAVVSRNMSVCAWGEIQVCSRREIAAVFFRWNMSFCARRQIQVCLRRASAAVLSHEHLSVPCADGGSSGGGFACARAAVALMSY